jgi:hypothetical protein
MLQVFDALCSLDRLVHPATPMMVTVLPHETSVLYTSATGNQNAYGFQIGVYLRTSCSSLKELIGQLEANADFVGV